MDITLTRISDIKANPDNPRVIKNEKFVKLVRSIKDFPEMLKLRPIVVNKDMVVLGGNMRLRACIEAGLEEVPVIKATDLTAAQEKEFIIKDNVGFGEWNWDELANSWMEEDLLAWGLDIPEGIFTPDEEKELKEDDLPDISEEILVQEGDIFELGKHRLLCGDSMNQEHIETLLKGALGTIHCISDPPYGIAYNPERHGMIKNDDTILDYTQLAKKYTDGFFCMWTGYQVVDTWMELVRKTFEKVTNLIIWHKGGGGMGDCLRTLAQDYEILIVSHRGNTLKEGRGGGTWYWNRSEKNEFLKKASKGELKEVLEHMVDGQAIWKVGKDDVSSYLHPTQKPVEINQRVLENFTEPGDVVLDLFGGSGSNLIACEKTRRKCRMMELDPKYVQTIIKRYMEYVGEEAELKCINREFDFYDL